MVNFSMLLKATKRVFKNRNVYGVFLGKLSFQLNTKNNFTFCRSYNKVQKFTPKLYSSRKTEKLCIFFSFLVCNINKK